MSEELSESMRLAIVVMLTGALLCTVLTVAIPSLKFLTDQVNSYNKVTDMSYRQLQQMTGEELDAGRIYRYIMEVEDKIGLLAVRESPVNHPNDYRIIICRERIAVTDALQPHIETQGFPDLNKGYNEYSTYFGHDKITEDFRLTVNTFPDGGLEIICDLTDEFYD